MGSDKKINAVEQEAMPKLAVKLYLSRYDALRELNDEYTLIHQDHDDVAVSAMLDSGLLVVLFDLDIMTDNNPIAAKQEGVFDNESMGEILGTLSHEAYHLACRWMEHLGEDKPGEEEMAYHVEAIAAALYQQLLDYFDK